MTPQAISLGFRIHICKMGLIWDVVMIKLHQIRQILWKSTCNPCLTYIHEVPKEYTVPTLTSMDRNVQHFQVSNKCFLRQRRHGIIYCFLSVLCHLPQTIYLTQQNIISSNNGPISSFSIDQSSSPFDKYIFLRNDIKMQYVPCYVELCHAYRLPHILSIHYPFTCSYPFAVKSPYFIYLII